MGYLCVCVCRQSVMHNEVSSQVTALQEKLTRMKVCIQIYYVCMCAHYLLLLLLLLFWLLGEWSGNPADKYSIL